MNTDQIRYYLNKYNIFGFNTWEYYSFQVFIAGNSAMGLSLENAESLAVMLRDNEIKIGELNEEILFWKRRYDNK